MTDNPLARSVAMSGVLGDRDRIDVVTALRRLAAIERAKRPYPSGRWCRRHAVAGPQSCRRTGPVV